MGSENWIDFVIDRVSTYDDFITAFKGKYWNYKIQSVFRQTIETGRYDNRKDGSMSSYVLKLHNIAKFLDDPIPEEILVRKLSFHFSSNIVTACKYQNVGSLATFIDYITDLETLDTFQSEREAITYYRHRDTHKLMTGPMLLQTSPKAITIVFGKTIVILTIMLPIDLIISDRMPSIREMMILTLLMIIITEIELTTRLIIIVDGTHHTIITGDRLIILMVGMARLIITTMQQGIRVPLHRGGPILPHDMIETGEIVMIMMIMDLMKGAMSAVRIATTRGMVVGPLPGREVVLWSERCQKTSFYCT